MSYIKTPKIPNNYNCIHCNFNTLYKRDYNNHLITAKHKNNTDKLQNTTKILNNTYKCNCGNTYKYRQGLSNHKRKCNFKPVEEIPIINTNFVLELIKENQEIKKLLIEQNKQNNILINKFVEKDLVANNITNNNNTNNNTINNNQKFNLNFFLNETCKDEMNMKDFIENIKVTFEELLTIGDTGFVNGVSELFIKRLQNLDITKRPIHCTDIKRETIYLKEEDKWNKDDNENTKLKEAIEKVEYKNVSALYNWTLENPESNISDTNDFLLKNKIYLETLQGDEKNRDKIIKNISKKVTIDRDQGTVISI